MCAGVHGVAPGLNDCIYMRPKHDGAFWNPLREAFSEAP